MHAKGDVACLNGRSRKDSSFPKPQEKQHTGERQRPARKPKEGMGRGRQVSGPKALPVRPALGGLSGEFPVLVSSFPPLLARTSCTNKGRETPAFQPVRRGLPGRRRGLPGRRRGLPGDAGVYPVDAPRSTPGFTRSLQKVNLRGTGLLNIITYVILLTIEDELYCALAYIIVLIIEDELHCALTYVILSTIKDEL